MLGCLIEPPDTVDLAFHAHVTDRLLWLLQSDPRWTSKPNRNKFSPIMTIWYSGCVRFARLRSQVSVSCLCGQTRCIAQPVETPKHSTLLCCKKFSCWSIWDLGWVTFCPCHVHAMSDSQYLEARWDPQAFELALMQKISWWTILDPEVRPVCKPLTAYSSYVHALSDVMYLEAWCDAQTFELVVLQKILYCWIILDPEVGSIGTSSTSCPCHVHAMSVVMYLEVGCGT